ncbi:MAG: peptidase, partial [Pseudomonadota bacterium]|nr:peptidase [Pseudomonadota bacterium]
MTAAAARYPIGTPGVAWGDAERAQWLSRQVRHRSYRDDVVSAIERLSERFDVAEYGQLSYPPDQYRLYAIRSRNWRDELPIALVTGGVHG